jgi:hypothetical protein
MPSNQPSWEGTFLAFALIFTALLGAMYAIANVYRFSIPWVAILLISIAITGFLRWKRR